MELSRLETCNLLNYFRIVSTSSGMISPALPSQKNIGYIGGIGRRIGIYLNDGGSILSGQTGNHIRRHNFTGSSDKQEYICFSRFPEGGFTGFPGDSFAEEYKIGFEYLMVMRDIAGAMLKAMPG